MLLVTVLVVAIIVAILRRNRATKNAFKMRPLVDNLSDSTGTLLQYEPSISAQGSEYTLSHFKNRPNANPLPYEEPTSLSRETRSFQPYDYIVEATGSARGSEYTNNNDIDENGAEEGEYHSPYYSVARC